MLFYPKIRNRKRSELLSSAQDCALNLGGSDLVNAPDNFYIKSIK
jgi:hypothetical protein